MEVKGNGVVDRKQQLSTPDAGNRKMPEYHLSQTKESNSFRRLLSRSEFVVYCVPQYYVSPLDHLIHEFVKCTIMNKGKECTIATNANGAHRVLGSISISRSPDLQLITDVLGASASPALPCGTACYRTHESS